MKLYLFDKTLKIHGLLGLPAMTFLETKIYKKALLSSAAFCKDQFNVFEYGSGYSTIYFAKFLKSKKINFCWHAMENNPIWYKKVNQMILANGLQDNINVFLCEFSPFWEKPGWNWEVDPPRGKFGPTLQNEIDYIHKPLKLNKSFDFIIVDARFRRRCLEVALQAIHEHGVVFLHDAEKKKYHQPLQNYPYARFLNSGKYYPFEKLNHKMWLGAKNNQIIEHV